MVATRRVYNRRPYKRHGGYAVLAFLIEKKFLLISIAGAVVVVILFFYPGVLTNRADTVDAQSTIPPFVAEEPSESPSAPPTQAPAVTPSPSPSAVVFSRVLKYTTPNMQGDDVWALQEKLGLKPDGYFGRDTVAAVVKFQLKNGLTGDGIAGDETLQKMGLK